MPNSFCKKKQRRCSGQGITEYAALLAFVACIIAVAFNIAHGSFFSGVSQSYSSVNGTLDRLNQASVNPASGVAQ